MWKVKIENEAARVFEGTALSDDDRIIIQQWAVTVTKHGPEGLLKSPSVWADHPLFGKWRGYRSSSFSYKGRIIYRVEDEIVTVIVVRITVEHDYKIKRN